MKCNCSMLVSCSQGCSAVRMAIPGCVIRSPADLSFAVARSSEDAPPRASVEPGSGNFRGFERINWGKPVTCVALICRHFLLGSFPKAGAGK